MGLFRKDRNLAEALDRVELEVRASDFQVRREELELRLDAFLCHHLTWRSRTSIQKLIKDGYVLVDHAPPESPRRFHSDNDPLDAKLERRPGRPLRDGARVVVMIPEELRIPPPDLEDVELSILYEDDEVLVVDKPAGLVVHPSGRHLTDSLIQRVHAAYRPAGIDGDVSLPIRLCHRLDRETSGLVLLGKGELAHREVTLQFENREVEKEYLAIVHGEPEEDEGVVELALGPALASSVRLKMAVQVDGLPSRTEWSVRERHGRYALVACRPKTGRQHQIRVHMDAIGHPLVGDKLYGVDDGVFLRHSAGELTPEDRRALGLDRHALHNHRLVWRSPSTGERHEAISPLAPDMRAFLDRRVDR